MSRRSSAAVVGAGLSGVVAISALKDEGFSTIACFEKTGYLGGLWRYHDDDADGVASVMKTTIINTSKEIGAMSKFPPPAEYPNLMHNSMMYEYIKSAAESLGALGYISFFHEVQKIEKSDDYEETGRWQVTCKNTQTGEIINNIFDCVLICIGHHVYPNIPTFPGQEEFSGKIIHSHSLKKVQGFENMRVVVVGTGNSGMDAAVELSSISKQVYLSTRRGTWILPKVGPKGLPIDSILLRRFNNLLCHILPYKLICHFTELFASQYLDHSLYNLKPKHRILGQHPTASNALPIKLLSGVVVIRDNIKTFTKNGVFFEGEKNETPVEAVVLCTGYKVKFPFLSEDILPVKDNRVKLYKHVLPPDLPHPTLAILGMVQPSGPLIPISEMQCRWTSRIMNGKLPLPPLEKMHADIKKKDDYIQWRFTGTARHTFQVDFIDYIDELAEEIGCKPNLFKLSITDPKLFWHVFFGPSLSYQYRLQGPHAWNGARNAILTYNERVKAPLKRPDQYLQKRQSILKISILIKTSFRLIIIFYIFVTIADLITF